MSDYLGPPVPLFFLIPTPPTDTNSAANSVVEGAAVNTQVGITAFSTDFLGLPITYSLASDNSGGGFKIDPTTGVVTVADPGKIDFESAPGHVYTITAQASDFFGLFTNTQTVTIAVTDVAPSTPVDANAAANSVAEGAANGTQVGITASSTDVNGPGVTYSLTGDSSGGGFTVNPTTGVVTVADHNKIDFESSPGHAYTVTVKASDGTLSSSQSFTIGVTDVPLPTPVDTNPAANTVVEGAAAGTLVGLTATANDPNGPATVYSLIGDTSGGGFTINATTGIVTVANPAKIDFETAAGHAYSVTVQANDGLAITTQSFSIAVTDVAPSTPTDSDGAANTVAEGAANGSTVGVTASSTDVNGPAVTYALTGDSSGGGFTINAATGVVTVADHSKIDFETAPGHAYTVTAQASDGTATSSQTFTIGVTDVAPSTPVDSNAAVNSVAEGAAAGTTVGVTASSTDVNGPAVTYSLTGDTSGGGFTINAATGVITVADSTKIDYESAPGHAYTVTAQASDGTLTSSQTFTIGVTDVAPSIPVDSNAATNTIAEAAANGSTVGITASSTDVNGPPVTWALTGDTSLGGFTINATTGVVTIADSTKIDFESSAGAGHTYTVTAEASDGQGGVSSQNFIIGVTDVAPSTPVDSDGTGNSVAEGAANGTTVGVIAASTDVNGPAVTWSLTADSSGGGFTINAATGVVTVADHTKIDFESAPAHNYTVTAQASDGTLTSSQTFTIGVTNVAPTIPVDSDGNGNSVAEGAADGSTVGVTASSTDVNGPAVTYALTADTSGGGFTINAATGVVSVADHTKIDYESAPGHAYTVTTQASDGNLTSSQTFIIGVTDVAPSTPVDSDGASNTLAEGAADGSTVGVTASSIDVNGPAVTYALVGDTSGGGFTINAATGIVTVADHTKIDFESSGGSYTVVAQASDGTLTSSQAFVITVTDVAPSTPVDSDAAANQVSQNAPAGTHTGITASSTDVNGPAVTYSLTNDTSGGGFTVNSTTGVVTVADPTKVVFNAGSPSYDVTVDASDGTLHSQQTFTINVLQNTPPVANDDSVSATEAGGLNNAVAGVNPSGNVILGTGAAGDVQDTDAEDPSTALTVVAVHTGPEGGSIATGTVGSPLAGSHGTLTLHADGSYGYQVNQTDAQVQALHTSAETITDVFNYTIQDTGGLQDTASLTITIHGADDLPQAVADNGTMTEDDAPTSFNVIANDTQDPDHTASNAITIGPAAITVTGPAGETFANTDAQAAIVSNQIQVTLTNAHFQQLALGEHATVTVPYTLTGDAGETSTANLVVTVNGANDVPVAVDDAPAAITEDQVGTFTVLGNDTLDPDHGAPNNVTTGTVTNLVAPSGEGITTADVGVSVNVSNQVVVTLGANFQHMQDGQTATFDIPYTLHGDQPGDTSTATLHVTVNGANDAPIASNFTFNGVNSAIGNTDLVVNDPADGAPDPAGPQKTISASLLSGASDVDGPGPLVVVAGTITTAHSGTVTMQADGDFTYKPPVGYLGADSFTYTVSDQNPGVAGTATGTVTLNVASPHVWYVNADAASDGDGSSENPFNTLVHFTNSGVGNNVDAAGDTIVLENSTAHYTGGLTLENNEQLISQSAGLTINGNTLFAASGSNAVVDGGLVLGSGNTIEGVDFGTTSGFAVSGSSVGTLHLDDTTSGVINNGSGGGIGIGGSSNVLNVDFSSITTTAGTSGISLTNASGTFHAHGGAISGASGADVALNGGTVNFTDDGTVNDTTGTVVSVTNMTGGTQSFTGAITGGSVALSNNTGATIDFSGGLNLSTGTSNAFSATGGGTLNVTGTNHLTTTTGTALDIANTTIGSGNVTFHDISANGAANGIVLNNTGSSGGLVVTGGGNSALGGDNSGGTIQNTTGDGISLTGTSNVSLTNIHVANTSGNGIGGTTVNNFTLANSTVDGANGGSAVNQGSVYFTGLTGTANLTDDVIKGGHQDNVSVTDTSGTLDLTVSGSTIRDTDTGTNGNDNLFIEAAGTSTVTAHVQNNIFAATNGDHIQTVGDDSATLNIVVTGNTLSGGGGVNALGEGITISGGHSSPSPSTEHVNFNVSNNTMTGTIQGGAININEGAGSGVWQGQVNNNTIGNPAITDSGASQSSAIRAENHSNGGTMTVLIDGNHLSQYNGVGINLQDGESATSTAVLNATVTNNVETNPGANTGAPAQGLTANIGVANGSANVAFLNIQANTLTEVNGVNDIHLRQRFGSTIHLQGYAGANNDGTAVANFEIAQNPGNTADASVSGAGGGYVGGTTPLPIVPTLLAAAGGVQPLSPSPGEMNLSQSELDSVVAAAIAQWSAAGATFAQLAALKAATFSVADLAAGTIGDETSPAHITIDVSADGHGWFVDPTPADSFEFAHAANAAGTDLFTDPANAAAGHLDLLTTVTHELGHVLGLPDLTTPADVHDLMYFSLVDGERRLPDAADLAPAGSIVLPAASLLPASAGASAPPTIAGASAPPTGVSLAQAAEAALPAYAQAAGAPIVVGTAGNDSIDAGFGGKILFGGGGADNFVFGPNINPSTPAAPSAQPLTHVADYSAAQGDTFDFTALTSAFHDSSVADVFLVRAVEDASGTFATLQLNTTPDLPVMRGAPPSLPGAGATWANVAQLDGLHSGDAVNVLVDSHSAVHLAQIHVDLLV